MHSALKGCRWKRPLAIEEKDTLLHNGKLDVIIIALPFGDSGILTSLTSRLKWWSETIMGEQAQHQGARVIREKGIVA